MEHSAISRRFAIILGLSLVLHGALFAVVAWLHKHEAPALPKIIASFRVSNPPASGPIAQTAPSAPAMVPTKVRQQPRRAEHLSVPSATAAAGPTTTHAPTAVENVAVPVPSIPAVVAAPAVSDATPVRSQADLLGGYRQKLSDLLARRQEYPRIAAMRGWEGEVRLRLRVARKGNLLAVQLDHSSGFDVLDQHAVAMLEQLAGLPPLPDGLELNEIQVVVPVNYKLKKTT